MVQTVSIVGTVATTDGWLGPASFGASLFVGLLSVFVGVLLLMVYCRTNKLQHRLIELTREQHEWQKEQKDPQLFFRSALLRRFPSAPAFTVELNLLNPGAIPIQIEHAHVMFPDVELKTEDYSRQSEEFRLIKPYSSLKLKITVNDIRAKQFVYWPNKVALTLIYISASIRSVHFEFAVEPRTENDASLTPTKIEE